VLAAEHLLDLARVYDRREFVQAPGQIVQHGLPGFGPLDEYGQIVRARAERVVQRTILFEPAAPLQEFLRARLVFPEIRRRDALFD
jgi:hypothetical protein